MILPISRYFDRLCDFVVHVSCFIAKLLFIQHQPNFIKKNADFCKIKTTGLQSL